MNRTMALFLLSGLWVFQANASEQKQDKKTHQRFGIVSLQGSILEPTCAISAGSEDQSIQLTTLPIPTLLQEGQGPLEHFSIRLIECTMKPLKTGTNDKGRFVVTFDGPADGNNFQLSGQAKGVALAIADGKGNRAIPGQPMPAIDGNSQSMTLHYQMRVVSNQQLPQSGNYKTTLRFKLEYY